MQFSENPYIQRENILSLICMPIVTKGKSIGYMYLENNVNKGAFTKDRIETLNLITAQAAISIENAKLYESMEEKVRERTLSLENAIEVLQETKTELETEKSQMERIQFMSQEIQKKTNFQEILYSLEEIVWNAYKISDYILAIKNIETKEYRAFSLCKHWEKFGLKEKLKNVSIEDKFSIYHLMFTKSKIVYLPKLKITSTGEGEDHNRMLLGMESMFAIPCIINNETFAVLSFSDIRPEYSRDPSIRGVKSLTIKQRKEIEQLVALIANSLYQSLQNEKIEKAHRELQTTQAQLVEAEKSAALGQLISGVAHEINNPLAAIRSSAEILEMDQARILGDLPRFFQSASPETLTLFLELQTLSSKNKKYLPSREERQRKKQIRSTFETIPFESPATKDTTIELISELFLEDSYQILRERTTEAEALQILQMLSLFSTQKNALKNIRLSTEKSARVIFSLRKFLGTEIKGTPRQIRISDLLESSLRTYDNYIQGIVQLERDFTGDTQIVCVVDEIQQVLKNLIFNAIQSMYASPLKKLKIVVQKVDTESGEKRKVFIEDSGLGVGEDVVQKLFTPFFTTKSRGEGIGLGLYVSKLIVEEHGGRLEYEAIEGGARFSVWI
ncbi:MAG: GAF domain-containing protein [Spirochaetia bacterium]|nr:GAF domain-containing protein [Spirochaetia bacterium]